MNRIKHLRPTPALIVALIALVAALSGAAIALPGKSTVSTNDIKNGAVTKKKLAKASVGSQQIIGKSIKGNRLKDGTIKGKQVADEGLSSDNIDDYAVIGSGASFVKLTATDGTDFATARGAAPATELFKKGQLTVSAKCLHDTTADVTRGEITIATAANGAIFSSTVDSLEGGAAASDFLNTDTADTNRAIGAATAAAATANLNGDQFSALAPDGTHLVGQETVAAKTGALAGGNGVYGDGNVCLFGGQISG